MTSAPFAARTALAVAALACCLGATQAQTPANPATPAETSDTASFDVGRVVISAARRGPLPARSVLTSVDVVGAELLQTQTTQATWELFALTPGALLTPFHQGTTSGKVSLRGFNGEGEVNAVKLLIDGVPANSNDGNMPYLDAVFPLELEAIEVVRGTNDARHGLHNIAGNVNLLTRRGGNHGLARAALGSFDSADVQMARGRDDGTTSAGLFVGHKRSAGWRAHAESTKTTLSGQWFVNGAGWQAGVTARHFRHEAEEPGYLPLAVARQDPARSLAFSATDGGQRQLSQLAVHVDAQPAERVAAAAKLYVNRYIDQRWVQFSAGVSQQERDTDETHLGLRTQLSWRPQVATLHALALEGGFDLESQHNASQRYTTAARTRTAQTRDQQWTLDGASIWLQAVVQPVAALKIVPAWRVDRFDGDFSNLRTGVAAPVYDYGSLHQPKLSVVYTPEARASLYGNWGRSFQIGVGAAAYKVPPLTEELQASVNDGWELGLKFQPWPWLDGRLALWQQTASNELRRKLNDPSGDSENIGSTRRRGIDVQLALRPVAGVEAWFALTRQQAIIVVPEPSAPATAGREIDHVPHHVLNAGLTWQVRPALQLSATAQAQGDYFLERTNTTGRFGGSRVLNLGATWTISPTMQLQAQVMNATDRANEYVWWDGSQSLHSPGAPRRWSLAVSTAL